MNIERGYEISFLSLFVYFVSYFRSYCIWGSTMMHVCVWLFIELYLHKDDL